ncbi:NifB/NifX family molybdenum-iron cluster-binding protein [Dehalogenimonas sp. THU2]|uniref:NifB/NifX family molybdenum-iron cluster-binding protein n=1 Tax=Dehalogenimonas sp. THU2 TaxID=3151121 RepID=UPI003218222C
MKYAIPVYGGRLSAHFGQSSEFMLIDVDEKGTLSNKETIAVTPHNCGGNPKILADKGVKVVLAGGMGMGPRIAFERQNIQVVLGVVEPDPEQAVIGHFNRTLVSGQNVCSHGDSPCDHAGQHHHGHN